MTVSSGLVASVQSLVAILQQQIDTNSHQTPAGSQNATTLQNLPTDNVMHFDSLASLLLFGAWIVIYFRIWSWVWLEIDQYSSLSMY